MRAGRYNTINFGDWTVKRFIPYVYSFDPGNGCGAATLALLTGHPPEKFKERDDWTSRYMLSFLRKNGFKIVQLTKRNVTNFWFPREPIDNGHVVLMSIKLMQYEASWVVLFNERMYHNFSITKVKAYELLNHPILEAFLIKHPSWEMKSESPEEPRILRTQVPDVLETVTNSDAHHIAYGYFNYLDSEIVAKNARSLERERKKRKRK